jgi:hypothetical protein
MNWIDTPDQVKGYFKRKDIVKWKIEYFPIERKKKWTIYTTGKPKIWEWIEENVNYGKD